MNNITEQELHISLKQKINKIDQLEKNQNQNSNEDLKQIKKDIDSLKTSVDNGKNNLYSAIIGKKVTPRSKDFVDLTSAVNLIQTENTEQNKKYESQISQLQNEKAQLQSKIASIKPAKGNAQPYQVSKNATFTNDSGQLQQGILDYYGVINITPKISKQTFNTGIYGAINIEPITTELIKNDLSNDQLNQIIKDKEPNLKPENILKGINIAGILGTKKDINIETFGFSENVSRSNDVEYKIKSKAQPRIIISSEYYQYTQQTSYCQNVIMFGDVNDWKSSLSYQRTKKNTKNLFEYDKDENLKQMILNDGIIYTFQKLGNYSADYSYTVSVQGIIISW